MSEKKELDKFWFFVSSVHEKGQNSRELSQVSRLLLIYKE